MYAQRVTGLVFDDKLYQNAARLSPSLKFTANDIPVYSLKKFCPTPGNQGNMGSCVGWATSYAALTIAQAIRENQTNKTVITEKAKSALYVYNQIKISGCTPGGAIIDEALELIKEKGACEMKDFNPTTCEIIPGNLENVKAKDTRITHLIRFLQRDIGRQFLGSPSWVDTQCASLVLTKLQKDLKS